MEKLLTIVVPVYRVEQYINKCLDSCVLYKKNGSLDEERMNQLEVIIVNDGTPDNSAELSREYTRRFPQTFRQIDKENGGHGSAWNVGLKEATGKYLRFLDSDDWLTNLDKLMDKLADTDADLVFTRMSTYYAETDEEKLSILVGNQENLVLPIEKLCLHYEYTACMTFWLCTYKTCMLQPYAPIFDEGVSYDDRMLYTAPIVNAKTFYLCDFVLYNYLIGRVGQSSDIEVFKRKIGDHVTTYASGRAFWMKQIKNNPAKMRVCQYICADSSMWIVSQYSKLGIKKMFELKRFKPIFQTSSELPLSKQSKRFLKLPLFVFAIIESLRNFKQSIRKERELFVG